MSQILTVIGARPQFIKAAAVSRALADLGIAEDLLHTGQHYDVNMSESFFTELEIPTPRYNLGVGSGSHGEQTARMLSAIEEILLEDRPDLVLVYGDTNSTLAGALAAAKLHIPVAHVEAGLRSFNRRMPEELNRVLTDQLAKLLFAPTDTAVANLRSEGIPADRIHRTGDVMYDVALRFADKAHAASHILRNTRMSPGGYVLATVHRAENTDDPQRLQAILGALCEVAEVVPVVFPVHPRTLPHIRGRTGKIKIIEPVGYFDMVELERNAALIATDSGGVQKEAFFHSVPCVTLREETEWTELIETGWNRLAPPSSKDAIVAVIRQALDSKHPKPVELYGTGRAAVEIAGLLKNALSDSAVSAR